MRPVRWLRVVVPILGAAALLAWLDSHPVLLPPGGPRAAASIEGNALGHSTLLLVDFEGVRKSGAAPPERRRVDLEWKNLLTQALGGCDVADLAQIETALDDRTHVFISRQTATRMDAAQIGVLTAAVQSGLTVFVEAPDSALCQHMGLQLGAIERRPRLPWPRPLAARGEPGGVLRPSELEVSWTRFRYAPGFRATEPRPEVHLNLDGRPLGWVSPRGQGSWVVLAMDLAELSHRLRQHGVLAMSDATRDRHDAALPDDAWLDAWVEGVFGGALTPMPLPRLASAPFDHDGWLLCDSPEEVDTNWTRFAEARPDVAVPPASALRGRWPGEERGGNDPLIQTLGLGPVRPVARFADLAQQRAMLVPTPDVVRLSGTAWTGETDAVYAAIAGAGFTVDASLGPPPGAAGWQFGSSVPFQPLSASGGLFGFQEIVLHLAADPGAVDLRRIDRWMRHNANGGSGPVQIAFGTAPDPTVVAELAGLSQRHRHLMAPLAQLADWWGRRSEVVVTGRTTAGGQELQIGRVGPGSFALLVPVRWRDRALVGWDADWGPARTRRTRSFDRAYRLIELTPEASGGRLRLDYR